MTTKAAAKRADTIDPIPSLIIENSSTHKARGLTACPEADRRRLTQHRRRSDA
jgi:hypothetical protein